VRVQQQEADRVAAAGQDQTGEVSAKPDTVRFVFISDTHMCHNNLPLLPPGDVLVHTGDCTNHGSLAEVRAFASWFGAQPHSHKILVPGNHDMLLDPDYYEQFWSDWSAVQESTEEALRALTEQGVAVLIDKSITVSGVTVHGSPWVTQYASWRTAFNKTPEMMRAHWAEWLHKLEANPASPGRRKSSRLASSSRNRLGAEGALPGMVGPRIDGHIVGAPVVLLTHMMPLGVGDREPNGTRTGCPHLLELVSHLRPRVHAFGHNHSDVGVHSHSLAPGTAFVNAASVNDFYRVGGRGSYVLDVEL
jgi:Icc-related predicted phosphoesterase